MRWDESAGQELGAKQGEMIVDGNCLSFCVEVVYWCCFYAAGCYTEGSVLEGLEFLDGGRGGVWMPDGGSISEERPDEGFVCDDEGLLLLAPAGAS